MKIKIIHRLKMSKTVLKIGTRESPLALIQTKIVCDKLTALYADLVFEIVPLKTTGDKILDKKLSAIGGKGLFTKELEEALLRKEIDIAVHSMKDMPTTQPPGLRIIGVLEREDPRDVLVSKEKCSLQDLPAGSVVGTSSLRREAQLLRHRPDLKIVPIRGNVQTRLRKMEEGHAEATIMALAGLKRLGIETVASHIFSVDEMIPAVGQGIICIEGLEDDEWTLNLITPLTHAETEVCLKAERAFLKAVDGSCRTPIGGYADMKGGQIHLRGFISHPGGENPVILSLTGEMEHAEELGITLANHSLNQANAHKDTSSF